MGPPPELVGGGATAAIVLGSRPGAALCVCPYLAWRVTSELDEWNPSGRYLDCLGRTAAEENPDRAYPDEDDAADAGDGAAGVAAAAEDALLAGAKLWLATTAAAAAGAAAAGAAPALFTGVGG